VLNELQRRRVVEYLPDDPLGEVAFCVNRVTMFTLGNSMFVNADTLVSLQILGSEHHPNSQMQGPGKSGQGAKEDLSIYGLLKTLACTSQGKARLRQMLLRPSNDLDIIRKRHRSIAVLLRPENKPVLDEITKMLRKVKDIHGSLANLTKGVHQMSRTQGMRSGVWMTLSRFAHGAIELFGLVHNLSGAQSLDIVTQVYSSPECCYRFGLTPPDCNVHEPAGHPGGRGDDLQGYRLRKVRRGGENDGEVGN
jgi:DNA mismatch repair protein MSH5